MTAARGLKPLAVLTAVFAYALVALSPIVRITGSGLGCGDHWPLCNGRLIPDFHNYTVAVEWGHRLAAASVSTLVILLALAAWFQRDRSRVSGPGGVLRPALLAAVLLVVQVLLGAVTVWFELPTALVVIHLANAMALLATVLVAAFRTWPRAGADASRRARGGAMGAAALGAIALLLGGLVANLNAGMACTGFPLCGGQLWPSGRLALVQWIHRLVAYALVGHVVALWFAYRRRGEAAGLRRATTLVAATLLLQVVVAALLVAERLPFGLRTTHAAVGTLVWVTLVLQVLVSRPPHQSA